MRSKKRTKMGKLAIIASTLAATLALALPAIAQADFGIASFDVRTDADEAGDPYAQAGGHPYSFTTHIEWNNHPDPDNSLLDKPDDEAKDAIVDLPAGFVGNPVATPTCTAVELTNPENRELGGPSTCPVSAQVGTIHIKFSFSDLIPEFGYTFPLFNMTPPVGKAARFGFMAAKTPVYLDAELHADGSQAGGYTISTGARAIPEALQVVANDVTFWGTPADPSHDKHRCNVSFFGFSLQEGCGNAPTPGGGEFPSDAPTVPFLRLSTSCPPAGVGQEWTLDTNPWQDPSASESATVFSHVAPYWPEAPGPQQGPENCDIVPFKPKLAALPSQQSAGSPSGLQVKLTMPTEGLLNPEGIAQSDLKKAVVTLPEGVTVNPSQADGLGVCGPAQYEAAKLGDPGCPSTAKIGTVAIHTPLLNDPVPGAVYIAEPYKNPFNSLLALYIVLESPERGVFLKLAGRVDPDPKTGQLVTTFDDAPQLPFESFEFKFREGPRAPLITPSRCGAYETKAELYPWARPDDPVTSISSFEINRGPNDSPCPQSTPFSPGFSAGTLNNNAGSFSPFLMRLTRQDGEQDMTKFSAVLPPGVVGKLAGVSKCPDSAIALASQKTGIEERESPSCPANSAIGTILAGAGVGSTLVHVPGSMYLAGPYNGAPLSIVVLTPAVAGPFDVGTVITRVALSLDPKTAEVHVDGDRSDPIPHILKGIPLSVREIRVNVDRPEFTINPTSCDPSKVRAKIFGSNFDLFSAADDVAAPLADRFQAASCSSLGFRPKLGLKLKGGTRRGGHPALQATYTPRKGDANIKGLVVRLPRSAFLDQGHIRTICTRVQFAADSCPPAAQYGYIKAWTPLLDDPLEGPVYLRSSNHRLPDLVFDLHGLVDVEVATRIDSVKGGIRATVEDAPDAPISKVLLKMQGAKKGLVINSRNLCGQVNRANVEFEGQNGKVAEGRPELRPDCAGKRGRKR